MVIVDAGRLIQMIFKDFMMTTMLMMMTMPLRPICSGGSQLQWRKQTDGRQVVAGRSIVGFLKPQKPQKCCHTETLVWHSVYMTDLLLEGGSSRGRDSRTENWSQSRSKTSLLSDFPPTNLLSLRSPLWVPCHTITTYELHRTNLELSFNVPGVLS